MEIEGKAIQRSICINCAGIIEFIEWGGQPGIWMHVEESEIVGGGMQGTYCAGSPKAEPEPGAIERIES